MLSGIPRLFGIFSLFSRNTACIRKPLANPRPASGTSGFGMLKVKGRMRSPRPAASTIAVLAFAMGFAFKSRGREVCPEAAVRADTSL